MAKHLCPLCEKYYFEEEDDFDICPICEWENTALQEEDPYMWGGANRVPLKIAKEDYKNGLTLRESVKKFFQSYSDEEFRAEIWRMK